jgi:hypothetical protein
MELLQCKPSTPKLEMEGTRKVTNPFILSHEEMERHNFFLPEVL